MVMDIGSPGFDVRFLWQTNGRRNGNGKQIT